MSKSKGKPIIKGNTKKEEELLEQLNSMKEEPIAKEESIVEEISELDKSMIEAINSDPLFDRVEALKKASTSSKQETPIEVKNKLSTGYVCSLNEKTGEYIIFIIAFDPLTGYSEVVGTENMGTGGFGIRKCATFVEQKILISLHRNENSH